MWQPSTGALRTLAAWANGSAVRLGRPARRGRIVRVPIYVAPDAFQALSAEIQYDPAQLRPRAIRRAASARQALMQVNTRDSGVLRLAVASSAPVRERRPFVLEFDTIGGPRRPAPPAVQHSAVW